MVDATFYCFHNFALCLKPSYIFFSSGKCMLINCIFKDKKGNKVSCSSLMMFLYLAQFLSRSCGVSYMRCCHINFLSDQFQLFYSNIILYKIHFLQLNFIRYFIGALTWKISSKILHTISLQGVPRSQRKRKLVSKRISKHFFSKEQY